MSKIIDYIKSPEGKKSMDEFFGKLKNEEDILKSQLERFHVRFGELESFRKILKKIIEKYDGDAYRDLWFNRNIEPPCDLYFFLFEYAEQYGRLCLDAEWEQYGNTFTGALYYVNGYYFNMMNGQGTIIKITEENKIT